MGWATPLIELLKKGRTVKCRPQGRSMEPEIRSGQLCTIQPTSFTPRVQVGDVVLCLVAGNEYLHYVAEVKDGKYLIKNARGRANGWCPLEHIYGVCTKVED